MHFKAYVSSIVLFIMQKMRMNDYLLNSQFMLWTLALKRKYFENK